MVWYPSQQGDFTLSHFTLPSPETSPRINFYCSHMETASSFPGNVLQTSITFLEPSLLPETSPVRLLQLLLEKAGKDLVQG